MTEWRSASSVNDLDQGTTEKYWEVVQKTLVQIFGTDTVLAEKLVGDFRRDMVTWPEGEQLFLYNDEALSIAEALAGRPITQDPDILDAYQRLSDLIYGIYE